MSLITGFGGGGGKSGGGGAGGSASEDPNTLRSTQYATVLDALSEGPIFGLVNGAQSVFFDKVPLQNADGTYNFNNASFGYTTGDIASNQHASSALTGDASYVESTTSVGVQVWQATPIVRTVTQANVDHIRVTISTPALTNTDTSNGHVSGNTAWFSVSIQSNGGGYVQVIADSFSGKTTSKYARDYLIPVSGTGPWDIKVTRSSADDSNTFSQSQIWFDEFTAIISTKMEYRHTAIAGISIDAQQFSSIPTRAYDVKGMIINIPSNYDPIYRNYVGTWDGTFKLAWSDNPAWIFYDSLTNSRYGLGQYINESLDDIWQLYMIAQYCDQLVPDGMGGMEPRFTCNLYLNTQQDAYKLIQDLASVFRAIVYWAGGAISVVQDAPSDPIQIFSPSNVIDGAFSYQGASTKAMHTVCLVTYQDPNNWYQSNVEYVQDDADVAKYGVIKTSITAIGCTSRGQAHRLGKWLLYSERLESETVTFRAGMDAVYCYPGAIIQTTDPIRAGGRMGGRVVATSADLLTVTLDAPYEYVNGTSPTFTAMLSDGTIYTGNIASSSGNDIVLTRAISGVPVPNAMYLISQNNLEPELWRVISISEVADGNQIEISGVSHNPSKYGYIEDGYNLVTPTISSINAIPNAPTNINILSSWYVISVGVAGINLTASWTGSATYFNVTYSVNNGQSVTLTQNQTSIDIQNANVGDFYTFSVQAVSAIGIASPTTSIKYTVAAPPPVYPADVTQFIASPVINGVQLSWRDISDPMLYDYEIRVGSDWNTGTSLGYFNGTTTTLPPLTASNYDWFIKARNDLLNESVNADSASLLSTAPFSLTLKAGVSGANYVLSWNAPSSMFAIDHYSIATGSNALNLTEFSQAKITQYQSQVNWVGNETFWVAAVDVAGNISPYTSAQITITSPSAPKVTAQVLDNNVELYWTVPNASLPITTYQIYKGNTFATASLIGSKTGGFTTINEVYAGTYTYWVVAVDSAGNAGAAGYLTTVVSAPPNYVLHSDIYSTFNGTLVDGAVGANGITLPIDTASTWAQHFQTEGWHTLQDQINAGFSIYGEPTVSSGSYTEVIDYGATLAAVNVTVTPTVNIVAGSPTYQVMISSSNASANGPWTDYPNTTQIYLSNFRWIKITISVQSPDNKSLLAINTLETKLAVSQKSDSGTATGKSSDGNGTIVYFNQSFIGVTSVQATFQGSTPVSITTEIEPGAYPAYFTAYLFSSQTGARVSGQFSWAANGY